ncbi:MAG: 30S ribosome-binding factor RbfA [Candidatus Melainabacteria bacterium]|nr:30S ribosome-binding factor RbfA [Candidatus Melainabacteria bacterium]
MSTPRSLRVAQQIKRELAEMLRRDLKDERISGIISITEVELTGDCRYARIFVSVYGDDADKQGTMNALTDNTSYIRGELCRRLKLRFAPEVSFRPDDSLERGAKVSQILAKISRGEI